VKNQPLYLGSNLHISQGLEVVDWSVSPDLSINLEIDRPGKTQGKFDLLTPQLINRIICNHREIDFQFQEGGYVRIPLEFEGTAHIEIT
jgi:hypothetical protein